MKFKYTPKEAIVQNIKNKLSGNITRHVVCVFDNNGEFETEDEKVIWILQNKLPGCTWDSMDEVKAEDVKDILSDDDLRQLAKEKGVRNWHNKKIENIKKELEV